MKTIDWNFKAINPTDYEIVMTCTANNSLLQRIFQESKLKMKKKTKIDVPDNLDAIDRFEILPKYLPLLSTILSPVIRSIKNDIREDNITIISRYITKASFIKMGVEWQIQILMTGQYIDKR